MNAKRYVQIGLAFLRPKMLAWVIVITSFVGIDPCRADIVTLKDGATLRCEVISDTPLTGSDAKYLQIRVENIMIWLDRDAVEKIEKRTETGPAGSELHNLVEKLKREGKVIEDLHSQFNLDASPAQSKNELQLTVKDLRGWIYAYEDRKAVTERKRISLHIGDPVPIGHLLILSPNTHATIRIGDIGDIGLVGGTQIRVDGFSVNLTQSYSLNVQLNQGAAWFDIGSTSVDFKRLSLTLNAAKSVILNGVIFVETTNRTGELNVTYLKAKPNANTQEKNKLNFWRKTDGPYFLSEGEFITISPASNRLSVEPAPQLSHLRAIFDGWDQWQPDPLVVELDITIPPLKEFPNFPPQPALHPYRIPIDSSMTLPPEIRSLGQILSQYKEGLERYRFDASRYPSEEHGLDALVKSFDVGGWRGPYIPLNLPRRDLWGEPFVYEIFKAKNREFADVRSTGPNRKDDRGLGDDIR
ncbi:MAG: hypothetical protein C4527_24830 [Candidatus Omnitrophota bacterium]|jgi:hypothetical protein|nr:MAG: hypothetical protein C4527_24830 [Candidatus Omnitrophota bacterium]